MYNVKQQIYLYFDKTQKSHLCSFLRSFVKQKFRLTIDEIYDEFVEDQNYYLKINSSRFEFLTDYLYVLTCDILLLYPRHAYLLLILSY